MATKQATATVASASLALLSKEELGKVIAARYYIPGGKKSHVLRDLFSRGYGVAQVYGMLKASENEHFQGTIYQMVRNYYKAWEAKK